MTPERYLEVMGAFATGQVGAEATGRALYGEASDDDLRRLAIHVRYLRWYRNTVLETHFPDCRRELFAWSGAEVREAVVSDYFRAHPPRELPMWKNAAAFPGFLAGRPDLPAWLSEIADLEWLEWQVTSAPDDPTDDSDDDALRVTPTLRQRSYRHDLLDWLDGDHTGAQPREVRALVIVWRDRNAIAQRATFGRLELTLLEAVRQGRDPRRSGERIEGFDAAEVLDAVTDLHAFGVLRGA